MPRAVFDTSVLISAFLRRSGTASKLLHQARTTFDLVLNSSIIAEAETRLRVRPKLRKYGYSDLQLEAYVSELLSAAVMIRDVPPLTGIVRDPTDDMIVACAVAGRADYVVTRDKDLLILRTHARIHMVTPAEFAAILAGAATTS